MSVVDTDPLLDIKSLRQALVKTYRCSEDEAVETLIGFTQLPESILTQAHQKASQLVVGVRKQRIGQGGFDAFLAQYNLSSKEGLALMCIAESLLRIPDSETVNRLIQDKLIMADWRSYMGKSPSMFVNAATLGLTFAADIVKDKSFSTNSLEKTFNTLIKRSSEPFIRKAIGYAMRVLGKQFVMGRTIEEALKRAQPSEHKGYRYSYDMLGEAARTTEDADHYFSAYSNAIHAIGKAAIGQGYIQSPGVSVKLSALHPRYEFSQRERVLTELVPKVVALAELAKQYNIGFTIDAEEAKRLELSLDIIEQVFLNPKLENWHGFGLAIQAYQKRCFYLIDWLVALAKRGQRRLMVRLVKGAYWDSEIKQTQVDGLEGYPVFTRKSNTDISYIACAKKLLQYPNEIYPQFATHNAYSVGLVMELAGERTDYEFQCLHGMGQVLYDQLVGSKNVNVPCRIYAPVGSHKELLPYLVRRLLENGANTSFVNRIIDPNLSIDELIADPIKKMMAISNKAHPKIPLPCNLYGKARINSSGIDLSNPAILSDFMSQLSQFNHHTWRAKPTFATEWVSEKAVLSPIDLVVVGHSMQAKEADLEYALEQAKLALPIWQAKPVSERAAILRKAANLLEHHKIEFYALAIREAGKTINDAIAEVREAVDFCRYYAQQSERLPYDVHALGVALCISPWNFPLAIFLGQVTAALVTGNVVLAKPAEQTPLIAARAIEILHQAGVPTAVVQLIPGRGSVIGAKLVNHPDVRTIMFTGSTETAQMINQNLADRGGYDVPFIAETGGQNVMIVDSSALPEQIVDDVLLSAFGSVGQRCSALRVLFVQDDIADTVITMLRGAMMQLKIGNPQELSTDTGPVIDAAAREMLAKHVEYIQTVGNLIYQVPVPTDLQGHFFPPTAVEINNLALLTHEVFGPILHIIRYQSNQLDDILAQINATGYGLTMGIHSRIDSTINYICQHTAVGNTYVNRNMIGAVVGVQPFGGEKLSGTGPKAGGPHYLYRLCRIPCPSSIGTDYALVAATDKVDASKTINAILHRVEQASTTWSTKSSREHYRVVENFIDLLIQERLFLEHFLGQQIALSSPQIKQDLDDSMAILNDFLCESANWLDPHLMQGPTGETNQLFLHPRGIVLAIITHPAAITAMLSQMFSALLTGNTIILCVPNAAEEITVTVKNIAKKAKIPDNVLEFIVFSAFNSVEHLLNATVIDSVMFAGDSLTAKKIKQILAQRSGSLIPLILKEDSRNYLKWLTVERTLTINTTASGGNATLLSLTEN